MNYKRRKLLIEILGPPAVGKTTILKKIKSIHLLEVSEYTKNKNKFFLFFKFAFFILLNLDLVYSIFVNSKKKYFFKKNFISICGTLFIKKQLLKEINEEEIVVFDESLFKRFAPLIVNNKIENPEKIISIYNKKWYNNYNIIGIYKDLNSEETAIRKIKRDGVDKNIKKLASYIKNIKKVHFKYVKHVNYCCFSFVRTDNPKHLKKMIEKKFHNSLTKFK